MLPEKGIYSAVVWTV